MLRRLVDNFVRLGRDGMVSLLVPWLGIALIDFGFVAISILIVVVAADAAAATGSGVAIQLIGIVQALAVMTLRVALLKTLRDVAFEGPMGADDLGAAARDMLSRVGPAFLITLTVGIIVSIGMIFCILPGLVALFFFAFAPYLVVTHGMAIVDALRESARWARREWLLLLTALLVAIVAVGVWTVIVGAVSAMGLRAEAGVPLGLITGWLANTVLGYLAFLWWGAVYVTADSRRQVESLRETTPGAPPRDEPSTFDSPRTYQRPDDH